MLAQLLLTYSFQDLHVFRRGKRATLFFARAEVPAPSLFPEEGFHSFAEGFADEVLRFAILVPVESLVLG